MNWDNQDKDPWGGKNDAPDFDDLIKKFSAFIGGKDSSSGKGSEWIWKWWRYENSNNKNLFYMVFLHF